jgi:S-adenosylmethionine hydrolase
VAAGLSLGISLYEFGEKISSLHVLPIPKPSLDPEGNLVGRVLYIDRFGNLITNIKNNDLPGKDIMVEAAGHCIQGINSYYAQNEGVMAIVGSSGYLEVSLRNGSACDFLGTVVGDEIRVISAI